LFFTKGQEAVEKWKKEKLEREANKWLKSVQVGTR
jgi:Holliday junction resolvase-like predicted endonuclease